MKNTFKIIIAFVLAFVMSFGSVTAFAEEDKTLNWDIYNGGYIYEFEYAGDFSGDKLVVDDGLEGQEYIEYYEIDIPQAGYYVVSIKRISGYSNVLFPERIEYGTAYGEAENKYLGEEIENEICTFNYLYYFSAGETVLGLNYSDAVFEIGFEFFDQAITDIEFEDNAFCGILGHDIAEDSGNGDMTAHGISAKIVFLSGKELNVENMSFVIEPENGLVNGENMAEVILFEYREPITVTIFEITDYIKSVEFKNPESITVKKYFNGDNGMIEFNGGEEFVVTFTDGTTVNTGDFVALPNGKEYFIRSSVTGWWNEKPVITVDVAQYTYGEYDVTAVEVTLEENLQHLKDINSVRWAEANYEAQDSIEYLGYVDGFNEKLTVIFWFPTIFTSVFFDMFCNIVEFAEYCAAI